MSQSSHQCVPATRAARVGVRASRAAGTRERVHAAPVSLDYCTALPLTYLRVVRE